VRPRSPWIDLGATAQKLLTASWNAMKASIAVCYFGTYDANHVRNRLLIKGLRSNGVEVTECHAKLWQGTEDKVREVERGLINPRLWWRLLAAYVRLLLKYLRVRNWDVMVVGYAGHLDVLLARALASIAHKPLVFDAFLSLHETLVHDRGLSDEKSMIASLAFRLERAACRLSDLVLLDTQAHARYFASKYGLPPTKFRRIWVGADESIYHPMPGPREEAPFTVIYFGKFIPLHGVQYIVEAAAELAAHPNISFELIGKGQTYGETRRLAQRLQVRNIIWRPEWLKPAELAQRVAQADVCLGIFGTSAKAGRVIPSKAYIALAMRKPLITRDSPAAREVLVSGKNSLLCPAGDAQALARCILALKDDPGLRERIAHNGHELFKSAFTSRAIGLEMKTLLEKPAAS